MLYPGSVVPLAMFVNSARYLTSSQILEPRFERLDASYISSLYVKGFLKYASVLMMLEVRAIKATDHQPGSDNPPDSAGEDCPALLPEDEPEAGAVLQGGGGGGTFGKGPGRGR